MPKPLCTKCGLEPRKTNRPWCLKCFATYQREYSQRNPEKVHGYQRATYAKHKKEINAKAVARQRKRAASGKCRACSNDRVYAYYCELCMARHRDMMRVRMRAKRGKL